MSDAPEIEPDGLAQELRDMRIRFRWRNEREAEASATSYELGLMERGADRIDALESSLDRAAPGRGGEEA